MNSVVSCYPEEGESGKERSELNNGRRFLHKEQCQPHIHVKQEKSRFITGGMYDTIGLFME